MRIYLGVEKHSPVKHTFIILLQSDGTITKSCRLDYGKEMKRSGEFIHSPEEHRYYKCYDGDIPFNFDEINTFLNTYRNEDYDLLTRNCRVFCLDFLTRFANTTDNDEFQRIITRQTEIVVQKGMRLLGLAIHIIARNIQ